MNGHRRGKSGDWQSQVKLSGKRTLFLIPSWKASWSATGTEGASTAVYWCEFLRFMTEACAFFCVRLFYYLVQSIRKEF